MRVLLLAVLAVGVAGSATVWILGGKLTAPVQHVVPLPPGAEAEAVTIPATGHAVAGWWMDAGQSTPVVLLLHGVRADRRAMLSRAEVLRSHGFSALLIDLNGHGETPGEAITFGKRESEDVTAALAWLRRNAPERRIGVVGCSLGGASLLLGPQPAGVHAVVLEAVYPRLSRAVRNRLRLRFGSLAGALAPLLLVQLEPRLGISPEELEPIRSIGRLGAPVLVVAGSLDRHTMLEESLELFDAASEPKELWVVNGALHQDFLEFDPEGYEAHVVSFLAEHLRIGSPSP
ncbi:MAG TPA: alpha/beta fold hydrolase [Candidatus Polarisedimenticolaceae bacterium]